MDVREFLLACSVGSALLVCVLTWALRRVLYIVPQAHVVVLEGARRARLREPGIYWRLPLLERFRCIERCLGGDARVVRTHLIPTAPLTLQLSGIEVGTRAGLPLSVDAVLRYAIEDPLSAVYALDKPDVWVRACAVQVLRDAIAGDEAPSEAVGGPAWCEALAEQLAEGCNHVAAEKKAGLRVLDAYIVRAACSDARAAELQKECVLLRAQKAVEQEREALCAKRVGRAEQWAAEFAGFLSKAKVTPEQAAQIYCALLKQSE